MAEIDDTVKRLSAPRRPFRLSFLPRFVLSFVFGFCLNVRFLFHRSIITGCR
jgi:hypothetical protein